MGSCHYFGSNIDAAAEFIMDSIEEYASYEIEPAIESDKILEDIRKGYKIASELYPKYSGLMNSLKNR